MAATGGARAATRASKDCLANAKDFLGIRKDFLGISKLFFGGFVGFQGVTREKRKFSFSPNFWLSAAFEFRAKFRTFGR
jgi:hypothetical protein